MVRILKVCLLPAFLAGGLRLLSAESPGTAMPGEASGGWRPSGSAANAVSSTSGGMQPVATAQRAAIAKVTVGTGTLPNDGGQVWREYDITPYTTRVASTNRPEQAIVDWILRETGYETWHGEPLGILSASTRTLRVYHTPQVQDAVSEIVDRFVTTQAETESYNIQVFTVGSPNWRAKMERVLRPVPVQTQGVQAWLLSKEDSAMLQAELRKRNDFRMHSTPQLLVQNGQATTVQASRPKNYIKDVTLKQEMWPGFEPHMAVIDEGFSLEFKPLLSLDGKSIDAVVKCNVDYVEKLVPVMLDVPTPAAPRQRTEIQVPQIDSHRFAEKFHWPAEMVLLIGCGMAPIPTPPEPSAVKIPLVSPGDHADLLVLVESRGAGGKPPSVTQHTSGVTTVRRF